MNKAAIVILNYESYQETEKCVDSIIEKGLNVSGIVVVDNGSKNESYVYLKRKYSRNSKIKIIRSKENLGFAKGNNLGIKIAKFIWKVDFILLLNSDTIILEEDYLNRLFDEYEEGIGIMQTSVLRLNGRYTQKSYGVYQIQALLLETLSSWCGYYNIYFPEKWKRSSKEIVGPWISGCDIFLTKDYFNIFHGLFPLTFLYGEEYILAIMAKKAGLKWKLVEDAHIVHAESKSTPTVFKEGTKKKQKMMAQTKKYLIIVRVLPLKILCNIINYGKWE